MSESELLGRRGARRGDRRILVFVVLFGVLRDALHRRDRQPRRPGPDGEPHRSPRTCSPAAFLFLWIAYFGVVVAANSLINLLGSHPSPVGSSTLSVLNLPTYSYRDAAIRACVLGGILVVFAGGAYVLHLRRGNALANAETDPSGPTKRVMRSYVALVSFVSIVVVVLALIRRDLDGLRAHLADDLPREHAKAVTLRASISTSLVLVVLAGAIFSYHQRFAPEGLRLLLVGSAAGSATPASAPSRRRRSPHRPPSRVAPAADRPTPWPRARGGRVRPSRSVGRRDEEVRDGCTGRPRGDHHRCGPRHRPRARAAVRRRGRQGRRERPRRRAARRVGDDVGRRAGRRGDQVVRRRGDREPRRRRGLGRAARTSSRARSTDVRRPARAREQRRDPARPRPREPLRGGLGLGHPGAPEGPLRALAATPRPTGASAPRRATR